MSTALLVIDMQNGFVSPSGSLPRAGFRLPGIETVATEIAAATEAARAGAVRVIYTRHGFRADQLDRPARLNPAFPRLPAPLLRGSWDHEVVDALKPQPDDVMVDKNRYDAFLYTDLELVLRAMRATRLVITGIVTHACVETTVRSAVQRDFEVAVASDGVAGPMPYHDNTLAVLAASFADVAPWRSLLGGGAGPHDGDSSST